MVHHAMHIWCYMFAGIYFIKLSTNDRDLASKSLMWSSVIFEGLADSNLLMS